MLATFADSNPETLTVRETLSVVRGAISVRLRVDRAQLRNHVVEGLFVGAALWLVYSAGLSLTSDLVSGHVSAYSAIALAEHLLPLVAVLIGWRRTARALFLVLAVMIGPAVIFHAWLLVPLAIVVVVAPPTVLTRIPRPWIVAATTTAGLLLAVAIVTLATVSSYSLAHRVDVASSVWTWLPVVIIGGLLASFAYEFFMTGIAIRQLTAFTLLALGNALVDSRMSTESPWTWVGITVAGTALWLWLRQPVKAQQTSRT